MSPVGSMLVSSRTTTGPAARRNPALVAAAWPRRSLVRTTSIGTSPGRRASGGLDLLERCLLFAGWPIGDNHDRRARRRGCPETGQGPGQVVGPVRREEDHRGEAGGWLVQPRRNALAGAVPDLIPVRDVGRRGRGECKIRASIDDPPAGGLDLGPQPVCLFPVPGFAGPGPGVRRRQHGVGDPQTGHPESIAAAVAQLRGGALPVALRQERRLKLRTCRERSRAPRGARRSWHSWRPRSPPCRIPGRASAARGHTPVRRRSRVAVALAEDPATPPPRPRSPAAGSARAG